MPPILEVLTVVALFLWFLSLLPVPVADRFKWSTSWLAWIAVTLIAVFLFVR